MNKELKTGFIDKTGEYRIKPQFSICYGFSEGLAAVASHKEGRKIGFIDHDGKFILSPQWSGAEVRFSERLAAVWREEGFGFINKSGELVIPYRFENVQHFSQGLCAAAVKIRNKIRYGFIDKTGDFVIPPEFEVAWDFDEFGVAAVRLDDDRFGYINTDGEYIWEPTK